MKSIKSLLLAPIFLGIILSACTKNPFGSHSQATNDFHPGIDATVPTITSVSPSTGPIAGGTTLTITGSSFQSGATVSLSGAACLTVTFVSATQLTCVTPAHATGFVSLTVTNPGTGAGTLANAFQFTSSSQAVPSMGIVSGGTIMTGVGVRLRVSAGTIGNPAEQSAAGVKSKTGLQGTLPHP